MFCFVIGKLGVEHSPELEIALKNTVRKYVGPFATPEHVLVVPDLPKTRSGKIMRRLLRKIALRDPAIGDVSTLLNAHSVPGIIEKTNQYLASLNQPTKSKL